MFGNNDHNLDGFGDDLITDTAKILVSVVSRCHFNSDKLLQPNQIRWKFTKPTVSIDDFVHVH